MNFFFQGILMGFAYVAPIGLQNLFVINTALTQKPMRVFLIACIVAFFDVSLALACFYGIGAIMEHSHSLKMVVLGIGSLIVMLIGIQLIRSKETAPNNVNTDVSLLKAATMACAVTWFNPQALIDGTMMLGAFRAVLTNEQGTLFITGVAFASCLWFFGISTFVSFFSEKFNPKVLQIINIVCGVVIFFYGLKLAYDFIELFLV